MAPNLRPTLSTRIRASFDGKGSRSNAKNPQETNTFIVQDATVLRDAIGQAINNDSFQNAIAAHLANLIKPSIKEALDTIQPVVETVYQHEILLRKTNRSVEDLLQRFDSAAEKGDVGRGPEVVVGGSKDIIGSEDITQLLGEHKAHTDSRFMELSSSVREGQGTMSQIVTDIAEIKATLSLSSQSLMSLNSTAQQSTTDNFNLQEQLDDLKTDMSQIMKSMETQSDTLVRIKEADLATAEILGAVQESHASHTIALNEIKAQDQSFKSASVPIFEKTHADTATAFQTLTANLVVLKENLKAGFASEIESISGLETKVEAVLYSIEKINGNDLSREILAGVQKSNDFHTAHTTTLEGIKAKLIAPEFNKTVPNDNTDHAALTNYLNAVTTTLDSHTSTLSALQQRADPEFRLNNIATTLDTQNAHLNAIKEADKSTDILRAIQTSNESHAAHTRDLEEIRTAARTANESHASHATDLGEIKSLAMTANAANTSLGEDFKEMKTAVAAAGDSHSNHTKDFGEIKSAVMAANDSHVIHTTALDAIRAANDNTAQGISSQSRSLEGLETQMGTVIATLGSQSIVHSDIRDAVHASNEVHASHSAALVEIKDTIKAASEFHISHATALEALKTAHGTTTESLAAQTKSLESFDFHLGSIKNILNDQSTIHSETRDAINASHTSQARALDGILAAHNTTTAQIDAQASSLDAMSANIGTITTNLQYEHTTHAEIKDAVQSSNALHTSHVAALEKAASTHAEILGGVSGSRDLLATHSETLASHTSLLDGVRDAYAKNHEDVVAHISSLKSGVDAHGSAIKDFHTETTESHAQIRDSMKALGDGVHLNEKGLGQLKEHTALAGVQNIGTIASEKAEPAARVAEAENSHSLVNGKSALGLGMGALVGGGLMAVAGKEGLFGHEDESTKEATGVEPAVEEQPVVKNSSVKEPYAEETAPEAEEVVKAIPVDQPDNVRAVKLVHEVEAEPVEYEPVLAAESELVPVEEEPVHAAESEPFMDEPVLAAESELVPVEEEPVHAADSEPVPVEEELVLAADSEPVPVEDEPVLAAKPEPVEDEPVQHEVKLESVVDEQVVTTETGVVPELFVQDESDVVKESAAAEEPIYQFDPSQVVETEAEPAVEAKPVHGLDTEDRPAYEGESAYQIEPSMEAESVEMPPESAVDAVTTRDAPLEEPLVELSSAEVLLSEAKDIEQVGTLEQGEPTTEPVHRHEAEPVVEELSPGGPIVKDVVHENEDIHEPTHDEPVLEKPKIEKLVEEQITEPAVEEVTEIEPVEEKLAEPAVKQIHESAVEEADEPAVVEAYKPAVEEADESAVEGHGLAVEENVDDLAIGNSNYRLAIADSATKEPFSKDLAPGVETAHDLVSMNEEKPITHEVIETENSVEAEPTKEDGSGSTFEQPILADSAAEEPVPEESMKEATHEQTRKIEPELVEAESEQERELVKEEPAIDENVYHFEKIGPVQDLDLVQPTESEVQPYYEVTPVNMAEQDHKIASNPPEPAPEAEPIHKTGPVYGVKPLDRDNLTTGHSGIESVSVQDFKSASYEPVMEDIVVKEPTPKAVPAGEEPVHGAERGIDGLLHDTAQIHKSEAVHNVKAIAEEPVHEETVPQELILEQSVNDVKPALDEPSTTGNPANKPVCEDEPAPAVKPVEEVVLSREVEVVKEDGQRPEMPAPEPETQQTTTEPAPERLYVEPESSKRNLVMDLEPIAAVSSSLKNSSAESGTIREIEPLHDAMAATHIESSVHEPTLEQSAGDHEYTTKEITETEPGAEKWFAGSETAVPHERGSELPFPSTQEFDRVEPVKNIVADVPSISKNAEPAIEPETQVASKLDLDDSKMEKPAVERKATGDLHGTEEKEAIETNPNLAEPLAEESAADLMPELLEDSVIEEPATEDSASKETDVENLAVEHPPAGESEEEPIIAKPLGGVGPSEEMHEAVPDAENETSHEAVPLHEDRRVDAGPLAEVEPLPVTKPNQELKPTTETDSKVEEQPSKEPAQEEPAAEPPTADEPNTINRDILAELTAGEPIAEPVVAKSTKANRAIESEPRPTLTKRVSFKEPLTEVKLAPEIDPAEEMQTVEEASAEEQADEDRPGLEDSRAGETFMETGSTIDHSLMHEQAKETELDQEEAILPVAFSASATEQPALEQTPKEAEKAMETESSIERNPPAEEPFLEESIEEARAVESSSRDTDEATYEKVKPTMEHEATQQTASETVPGEEISQLVEKSAVGEKPQSEIKPVEEGPAIETEHIQEGELEPNKEIEPAVKHPASERAVVEEPITEDSVAHNTIVQEPASVQPKAVDELPVEGLPVHESATEAIDTMSAEEPIAEEPIAHDSIVHTHVTDQPAVHDSSMDETAAEDLASEAAIAESKNVAEDIPVDELSVNKSAVEHLTARFIEEPTSDMPVVHDPVAGKPVAGEPTAGELAAKDATVEKATTEETSNNPELAKEELSTKKVIPEHEALAPKSAVHAPVVEDTTELSAAEHQIVEEPAVKGQVIYESVVEESTPEEIDTEEPVLRQLITQPEVQEASAVAHEPAAGETHAEKLHVLEPLTEIRPVVEDVPLERGSRNEEVRTPREVDTAAEEKVAAKELTVEDSVLEAEKTGEEEPPTASEAAMKEPAVEHPIVQDLAVDSSASDELSGREAIAEPAMEEATTEAKLAEEEPNARDLALEDEPAIAKTHAEAEPNAEGNSVHRAGPADPATSVDEELNARTDTHDAKPAVEVEPDQGVVHVTGDEPASEAKSKNVEPALKALAVHETTAQLATVDEPITHEEVTEKPCTDEPTAEEMIPETDTEDTKAPPLRVDSGIEVKSPTDVKSTMEAEPLRTVVEDPAIENATTVEPARESSTKEPVLEEPAAEAKVHKEQPVVEKYNVETKLAAEETLEEFHNTMSEPLDKEPVVHQPTEEVHFLDAEDKPTAESQPEINVEPAHEKPLSKLKHVMESIFHKTPVNGDSHAGIPAVEEPTATSQIKEDLHVDVKPATREQHTRVDSGIDIETPTKEPLGKLEPVMEVKPVTEIDQSGVA